MNVPLVTPTAAAAGAASEGRGPEVPPEGGFLRTLNALLAAASDRKEDDARGATESSGDTAAMAMAAAHPPIATEPAQQTPRAADVETPDRSLERIHPELRARLERVARRMEEEFGHRVELVEGYRSPERQRWLFEQGRRREGPVVTWTVRSQHTSGTAADLRIDGSWDDPVAYARLQRVAREEGLRTLGMRDPGHVELPTPRGGADEVAWEPPPERPQNDAAPARGSRPATVAAPARVAPVARPATPAAVAPPGGRPPAAAHHAPHGGAPTRPPFPAQADGPAGASTVPQGDAGPAVEAPPAFATGRRERTRGLEDGGRPDLSPSTVAAGATRAGAAGGVRPQEGATPAQAMERVLQIREALHQAGVAPATAAVRLDGALGAVEQVRVALRGSAVDAALDVSDARLAERLEGRASDLGRALDARGFEPGALTVRAVSGTPEARAWMAPLLDQPLPEALRALLARQTADPEGSRQGQHFASHDPGRGSGRGYRDGRQAGEDR